MDVVNNSLNPKKNKTESVPLKLHEPSAIGELDVIPFLARHSTREPFNYILQYRGKKILIAWDTGYWPESTWKAIGGIRLDAAFIECTWCGPGAPELELSAPHLCRKTFLQMKRRMEEIGLIDDKTIVVINHLAEQGLLRHDLLEDYWRRDNVRVGFDGFYLSIPTA